MSMRCYDLWLSNGIGMRFIETVETVYGSRINAITIQITFLLTTAWHRK